LVKENKMIKEKFVDRGGNEITKHLEDYYEVGIMGYDDETDQVIILMERKQYPVVGIAIIGCLSVIIIAIAIWFIISLYF